MHRSAIGRTIALIFIVAVVGAGSSGAAVACVTPDATISSSGPLTFGAGANVTLTAHGGTSYQWSNGATSASIVVDATGNYSVTAFVDGGCSFTSAPVIVSVKPAPSITAGGPTTFCAGSSVSLTATEAAAYQWSSGQTTRTIQVSDSGAYSVSTSVSSGMELLRSLAIVEGSPTPDAQVVPAAVVTDRALHRAYIGYGDPGRLLVLDTQTDAAIATIGLGAHVERAALNPVAHKLYVAGGSDGVTIVDTTTNTVTKHLTLGGSATGVAVNPATNRVYVTHDLSNEVWVLDGTSDALLKTITLSVTDPGEVAVNPNLNRIYVTCNRGDSPLVIIDGATDAEVKKITSVTAVTMAVDTVHDRLFVGTLQGSADINVFDAAETLVQTIPQFGPGAEYVRGIAYDDVRDIIYRPRLQSGELESIDGKTYSLTKKIATGAVYLYYAGVDPDANKIYGLERDNFTGSRVDGRVHILTGDFVANSASAPTIVNVNPLPDASIATASSVMANSAGNTATAQPADKYAWSITNGTPVSVSTAQTFTYNALATGPVTLSLTTTNASGCSATTTATVNVVPQPTISTSIVLTVPPKTSPV